MTRYYPDRPISPIFDLLSSYNDASKSAYQVSGTMETGHQNKRKASDLDPVESKWDDRPGDNFGYASEDERRAKRGLEDWEMVDMMADSQPGVFDWFRTVAGSVVAGIILFAVTAYSIYYVISHYGPYLLGNG